MSDPAAELMRYLNDDSGLNARERKNKNNRASKREDTIKRSLRQYGIDFPRSQGLCVIQSGSSSKYPVLEVFGPMSNDAVFAYNTLEALVRHIDAKNLRPAATHKLTIGGGGEGHVGVVELLEQATLAGMIGKATASSLLALSKRLNAGERWVLE